MISPLRMLVARRFILACHNRELNEDLRRRGFRAESRRFSEIGVANFPPEDGQAVRAKKSAR